MASVSALARLQSLPALFRGSDLTVRFQWASKTASHYLYLWKKRGLVQELGGRSDVFANLLVNRLPNWDAALRMAMPTALVMGVEALRRAGWTTQVPSRPEVAVGAWQPVFKSLWHEVHPCTQAWFDLVHAGVQLGAGGDLAHLRPAWALADMLHTHGWGACGLQPDDLELFDVTALDVQDWEAARLAFGLELPDLDGLALDPAPFIAKD